MIINEKKLRNTIRQVLLERYEPTKFGQPVEFGWEQNKSVEGYFLAKDKDYGFYIAIDADEKGKSKYKPVPYEKEKYKRILTAIQQSGHTLNKALAEKINKLLKNKRIFHAPDRDNLWEPMSEDEKEGIGSFLRDSGIEAGANISAMAAAGALSLGLVPLAAALETVGNGFNVADVFNKIDQKNYMGSIFSALGLIPGGDAIGLLKKVGKLDDVFPASLADDIAREIIKLVEGDSLDTLAELVHAWAEDRDVDRDQINPIISNMIKAGKEVAAGFQKMAGAGDVNVKKS